MGLFNSKEYNAPCIYEKLDDLDQLQRHVDELRGMVLHNTECLKTMLDVYQDLKSQNLGPSLENLRCRCKENYDEIERLKSAIIS